MINGITMNCFISIEVFFMSLIIKLTNTPEYLENLDVCRRINVLKLLHTLFKMYLLQN